MNTTRAIYPPDLAACFKDDAGRKYRPSNGTEGDIFQAAWCAHCARNAAFRADPALGDPCMIVVTTYALDVDDEGYPTEWQYGSDGQPRCTAFTTEDVPERCQHTDDMFGGPQ